MTATLRKDLSAVKVLLANGANPYETTPPFSVPIVHSCSRENLDVTRVFLDSGFDPNWQGNEGIPVLAAMVQQGVLECVALLIERGGNPNLRYPIRYRDSVPVLNRIRTEGNVPYERNVLHQAVVRGSLDIVELLLIKGAEPNVRDTNGETPLTWAKKTRRPDIVQALANVGGTE